MKKVIVFLCGIVLSFNMAFASSCFIAKEKDQIIHKEGDCDKRYSPCSTFKIALSLIGFDSGILENENSPQWPFVKGYTDFLDKWKTDHTPASWIKNSCVWYSQVLTQKLGIENFAKYVKAFKYGNIDISGDKDKNDGLTQCWLLSSLEISSLEQVNFLQNFLDGKLPVSEHAQTMTKNILFLEELPGGWSLYGKTGGNSQQGWFVGWIKKGDRSIVFANHIDYDKPQARSVGLIAKGSTKEKLLKGTSNNPFF
jgi:beta-lactamase class D